MKGCLHVASRAVAVLLAVAFAVTLPLSLVAFNIGRVAFSPERMTALLLETIDETGGLRQMVIESLTSEPGTADPGGLDLAAALEFLTPQERDYLGEQLTPPGWAKAQLGALVAGVYEWIDNDRARPSFVIDITDLKVALLAGGASDLVETVIDSWPPCSVEEIAGMGVGALLGEQSLKLCEPSEPWRSGLVGLINSSIALSLRALPDQISLGGSDSAPAAPEVMQAKERLRQARFLAGWSWLLSPVILGLVMALVIRSWRSLGLWWGIPLLVGALMTLATIVGVRVAVEGFARSALGDAAMPAWIGGMIQTLITAMMAVVFRRVALQAGVLLALGLVVLVGGLAAGRAASRRSGSAAVSLGKGQGSEKSEKGEPEEEDAPDPGEPPSGMFG
jgi:hypothetical protein